MTEHLSIHVLSCKVQTDQIDSGQKVPVYFWSDWQKLADFARRACSLRCELVREKKLDPPIRLRLSNHSYCV